MSKSIRIIVATMTGNAADCAAEMAEAFRCNGVKVVVTPVGEYDPRDLASEPGPVLITTSTFGNGEAPDCAYNFWEALMEEDYPSLNGLRFSVLALGDSSYPRFCQFGKDLNARLLALGATPISDLVLCDIDYEENFARWKEACTKALTVS